MQASLIELWLPIVLSTVALFFASFLSWMVFQFHRSDWLKLQNEDEFLQGARKCGVEPGNYMFPGCNTPEEMKSESHKQKWEAGPRGVMTVFTKTSMAQNLALTFIYFLVANFCLAYLGTLALPLGAEFLRVFRFMSTAALLVYLTAIVSHAIWFRVRIVGHVIDSVIFALIVGVIFAAMWPGVS